MIRAFHTSATGMAAQQLVLDNTANNLANLNTNGFKRSQVDFQDLIYTTLRRPGDQSVQNQPIPTGIQIGNGVRVAGTTRLFTVGAVESTGNNFDIAIQGDGFFQITNPGGGVRYTRDGSFRPNASGQLVTTDGFFLEPRISLPTDTISISVAIDGTINATTSGNPTQPTTVERLTLVRFANPAGLSGEGSNLFTETPASGTPQTASPGQNGTGILRGGYLERSNVEVVTELVNMIQAQRAYEFNT
ncbi:MAG: flagellar basal-body rod protein FlgG, partial [Planctomycetes bacterium]|nr:flagellar basal-body rod protein FlgG [Planctomycetota bacterium]